MGNFFSSLIDFVFSNSSIFDRFRNWVHDGYKEENNAIKKILRRDKKTLDFGCGIGQFAPIFDSKFYYGVDTDKKYIDFCKKSQKGDFSVIKTSPPYKFKEGFFDQIFVSAVIHHLDDKKIRSISKEFRRILKKNGKVMIVDHFTRKYQMNWFCKFLITLDRGNYFRNPKDAEKLFLKHLNLEKKLIIRNGPYKDYILVFSK